MEISCYLSVYLLGSQHHGDHTLWLCGLGTLINQDGAELHLGQTRITGTDAGTTYDISVLHNKNKIINNPQTGWRETGYTGKTQGLF